MPVASEANGLQVDEDLAFQRRMWKAQRIGWAAMLAIVVLALLGVFGKGPLSSAIAGETSRHLWMEYDRFLRHAAASELHIHVAPEESRAGTLEVWLSSNYVDRITVHGITPEPQGVEVAGDRVIFQFTARNPRQHVVIHVHYEVDQFGSLSGQVGTGDLSLGFSQFVYP